MKTLLQSFTVPKLTLAKFRAITYMYLSNSINILAGDDRVLEKIWA